MGNGTCAHRILKLARTIADLRPDAVHLTGPRLWNRGVLPALRRVGVPAVHMLRDLDPHFGTVYGPLPYVWNRGVLALADGMLVHGVRYQARLREVGLAEERVTCTPRGKTRLTCLCPARPWHIGRLDPGPSAIVCLHATSNEKTGR